MGMFVLNDDKTVKSLVSIALANLRLYEQNTKSGRYKDELGQTPPDYLISDLAIKMLEESLLLIESPEIVIYEVVKECV